MCFGDIKEHLELVKIIEKHIQDKDVIEITEKAIKLDLPVFGIQSYSSRSIRKGDLNPGTKIQENGPAMVMHIKLPNKVQHSDITDRRKILESYLRDPKNLSAPPSITTEKLLPLVKEYHDIHFYACPDEFLDIARKLDPQTLFERCLALDLPIFCLLLRKEELTIGVDHRHRTGIKVPKDDTRGRYNIFLNATRSLCNTILGVRDPPATILKEYLELVLIHDEVMKRKQEERARTFEKRITRESGKSILKDYKWNETTFKKVAEIKKRIETIKMGLCDQLAAYFHDNFDDIDPIFYEIVPKNDMPISVKCAMVKTSGSLKNALIERKLDAISRNYDSILAHPVKKAFINLTSVIANSARGHMYILFYNNTQRNGMFGLFKAINTKRYNGEKCILYQLDKWSGEFKNIFTASYKKVFPGAIDGVFFFPRNGVWNVIISDILENTPNTDVSIAYDMENHDEKFENRIEGTPLEINAIKTSFHKSSSNGVVVEKALFQAIQHNEGGDISAKYMFSSTASIRNMYATKSESQEIKVSNEDKLAMWKYVVEEAITGLPKDKYEEVVKIQSAFEYADKETKAMTTINAKLLFFYPEQIDTSAYPKFRELLKSNTKAQEEFEKNRRIIARIAEN